MRFSDITIVLQGAPTPQAGGSGAALGAKVDALQRLLPGARVVVSTWEDAAVPPRPAAYQLVLSTDPGPLPGFKKNAPHALNNVNRQIVSSRAGLAQVATDFALRMRWDCELESLGFLDLYARFGARPGGGGRIVASSFFSADPRMFEQMSFHVSDWFHFGPTQNLQALWSASLMSHEDATYHDSRPSAAHSTHFDRLYRARFAAEQQVTIAYARSLGYRTPDYHNDVDPEILAAHDEFCARELVIAEPQRLGIKLVKYAWTATSGFHSLNCMLHADWYLGAQRHLEGPLDADLLAAGKERAVIKKWSRRIADSIDPLIPLMKGVVMGRLTARLLRGAAGIRN